VRPFVRNTFFWLCSVSMITSRRQSWRSSERKRVLQYAVAEAERSQGRLLADYVLADDHIGPEHLLLGLLRETDAAAAAVLGRHGVTIDLARDEVLGQSRSRSVSE
jgi:ClpA/ClpB-like protein